MKIAIYLILLLLPGLVQSQDFDNYKLVQSSGQLPKEFIQYTYDKIKESNAHIPGLISASERAAYLAFNVRSNYMVDEIIRSGSVLFNDPMSAYIQQVADELLKNNQKLRSELRFYVVKSDIPNAFTTHQGVVFVTVGMLSRFENEAQLAFVLAHEISHYEHKHVIDSYLHQEKIAHNRDKYQGKDLDGYILNLSQYSHKLEFEADSLGALTFLKSRYDGAEMIAVFDILARSEYPFANIPFDFTKLEAGTWQIADSVKNRPVEPIEPDEHGADEHSSHPNVSKRKEQLNDILQGKPSEHEDKFLVGKELFYHTRTIARFESLHLKLLNRDYAGAVYCAHALQQEYPNSKYLSNSLVKGLYGVAVYELEREQYQPMHGSAGESAAFFAHMKTVPSLEMACIALTKIMAESASDPADDFLTKIELHLVQLLRKNDEFQRYTLNIDTAPDGESITAFKALSKIFDNAQDKARLLEICAQLEKTENEVPEEVATPALSDYEQRKLANKRKKVKRRFKWNLGLDSIIVVDPFMLVVHHEKGINYQKAEKKKKTLTKNVLKVARRADLHAESLYLQELSLDQSARFHNISLVNSWLTEKLAHDEVDIIPIATDDVKELIKTYGTSKFFFSGVAEFRDRRELTQREYRLLLLSAANIFLFPVGVARYISAQRFALYYSFMFDLENGALLTSDVNLMTSGANIGYINGMLYEQFKQIKNTNGR